MKTSEEEGPFQSTNPPPPRLKVSGLNMISFYGHFCPCSSLRHSMNPYLIMMVITNQGRPKFRYIFFVVKFVQYLSKSYVYGNFTPRQTSPRNQLLMVMSGLLGERFMTRRSLSKSEPMVVCHCFSLYENVLRMDSEPLVFSPSIEPGL